jgi:ABC-2 type transport system permease protein
VISFILAVVACGVLVYAGMPTTLNYLSNVLPASAVSFVESMSLRIHFESIQKGVLEFKDISYFVILIVGWVSACSIILSERKAS